MRHSESIAKLSAALVKAISEMGGVGKSGNNTFDRYTYAKLEDYVKVAAPVLARNSLCILSGVPAVIPLEDRTTQKGGKEHCVRVSVTMRILHESGEWIEAEAVGEGQDRADKAIYKAITGARKYGIASLLCLATTDDPEGDEGVGHAPPPAQRQTPKNNGHENGNGKSITPKGRFAGLIQKWSGVNAEDLRSASQDFAKKFGVKDVSKATAEEYERLFNEGAALAEAGTPFMEAIK